MKTKLICKTKFCKRKRRKHSSFCYTCNSRKYRLKNPLRYSYQAFKDNAKRRGKEFLVTYDEYVEFGQKHGLFRPDGTRYTTKTIDRIDCDKGYHIANMQVLSLIENSKKRYVEYFRRQNEITEDEKAYIEAYREQLNKEIREREMQEREWELEEPPF